MIIDTADHNAAAVRLKVTRRIDRTRDGDTVQSERAVEAAHVLMRFRLPDVLRLEPSAGRESPPSTVTIMNTVQALCVGEDINPSPTALNA